MSRERMLCLTFMTLGVLVVVTGALWLWLGYRGTRTDPYSGFSLAWPTGSIFIGLLVGAGGASVYPSD
jgi:hypothetical protein